ncbi:MAG: HalOD1 output domain-containing protein [Haloarculaceae archaeon]
MSETRDRTGTTSGQWSVVEYHDWEGPEALEGTLRDAVDALRGDPGEQRLYDYIDVEAVTDVLAGGTDRGASQVRFEVGPHEVRVSADGTIAAR